MSATSAPGCTLASIAFDEIEAVIPGFERYNERVRKPDGFYLPDFLDEFVGDVSCR